MLCRISDSLRDMYDVYNVIYVVQAPRTTSSQVNAAEQERPSAIRVLTVHGEPVLQRIQNHTKRVDTITMAQTNKE
jgi:hypothetical protein